MSLFENDLYEELFANRHRPFPEETPQLSRRRTAAEESDYAELQFDDESLI